MTNLRIQMACERLGFGAYTAMVTVRERRRQQTPAQVTRHDATVRVCVIGGGLSGLLASRYLLSLSPRTNLKIHLYEATARFGGRAAYSETTGEHCPRTMLPSYTAFLAILREIPDDRGGAVVDHLIEVAREARDASGDWRAIGHVYSVFDGSFPLRDQVLGAWRRKRLAPGLGQSAPQVSVRHAFENSNRLAPPIYYSTATLRAMLRTCRDSRMLIALPGRTDEWLIDPIVADLRKRGVKMSAGKPVVCLRPTRNGIQVITEGAHEVYDFVVLAVSAPHASELLDTSQIRHAIPDVEQTHVKTITARLDPDEPILARKTPVVRYGEGVSVLLQPSEDRAVLLAGKPASTTDGHLLRVLGDLLQLQHPPMSFTASDNLQPCQGVWAADPVPRSRLRNLERLGIYPAGGWIECAYPLDSAEAACRTAHDAVRQALADHAIPVSAARLREPYGRR